MNDVTASETMTSLKMCDDLGTMNPKAGVTLWFTQRKTLGTHYTKPTY